MTLKTSRWADVALRLHNRVVYACTGCGARRCKLWRQYQTTAARIRLKCVRCAGANQGKDVSSVDDDGTIVDSMGLGSGSRTCTIGWLIPAVPTAELNTYWGFSNVPEDGAQWWRSLPSDIHQEA